MTQVSGGDNPLVAQHPGEDVARERQADDTSTSTDALDPTGALPDQMAAKQAANALGDQDAVNLATPALPAGADVPNATNVRRYPHLFTQEVIDSFNTADDMDDEQRDAHNAAVEAHWRDHYGVEPVDGSMSDTSDSGTVSFE